ncbi:MAG: ribonuclease III [Bacteroidetes bacterium]|nr:ribonuclease III [Bacteroidota bacterium]
MLVNYWHLNAVGLNCAAQLRANIYFNLGLWWCSCFNKACQTPDSRVFGTSLKRNVLSVIRKIFNYFYSRDKEFTRRLFTLLGFIPVNLVLFKLAFSHKSNSTDKSPYAMQNNERLEYLGDAVLGTIVAEYLFRKYPSANEGFLTKMRSKIVKRKSLNKIGEKMGLDLLLAEYNQTRLSKSMLGNAVEALVGAVYLEKGYKSTRRFVIRKILKNYVDVHELEHYDDNYKSQLLEWCQKHNKTISYKLLARYKFEKRDRFKVAVIIDGKKIAQADDFNKKSAEQTASEKAMNQLGIDSNGEKPEKSK